ncbi:hypothetical protein GOV05_05130 [Candidatus Woesearchaeota archaeon]|nr:hypothetical protein [Candidatus Woesearchaeota archaeon]
MPHQCVRCNTFYDDGAQEILKGCSCGAKLFFYVKKEKMQKALDMVEQLTKEEKSQMEHDVFDIIGEKEKEEKPVVLDFEAVNVVKPGKYEIDIVKVMKQDPLIYRVGEGKYMIDLKEAFKDKKE